MRASQILVDDEVRRSRPARRYAREVMNTDVVDHPDVKLAAAEVRTAYLNLERMTIVSPVTGYVAKRNVQLGAHVDGSAPLMVVVPMDQIWVNANFKESQLDRIRPGQPVTLRSRTCMAAPWPSTARWWGWMQAPAVPSRSCRRRTPPATGSRWCSAYRCG